MAKPFDVKRARRTPSGKVLDSISSISVRLGNCQLQYDRYDDGSNDGPIPRREPASAKSRAADVACAAGIGVCLDTDSDSKVSFPSWGVGDGADECRVSCQLRRRIEHASASAASKRHPSRHLYAYGDGDLGKFCALH